MTVPTTPRPQRRRPSARLLLTSLAVGSLLGASAGLLLSATRADTVTVEAVLALAPASQIYDEAGSRETDETALVQSELFVLAGPALEAEVQRLVGGEPVDYSAAQVGSSTIITVTSTASTTAEAARNVSAVITAYSQDRERRLRAEISRAAAVVDGELTRLESDSADSPFGAAALQQEYGRLLGVRSGLFRAQANVDQAVTVVQPPVVAREGLPDDAKYGVGGLLVGAMAGLLVVVLRYRLQRSIQSADELVDLDVPVLLPEVASVDGTVEALRGTGRHAADMRLLVGQLVAPHTGQAVVLLGTTRGSGTSFAAVAVAASLSERSPVLLVLAADVVQGSEGTAAAELGLASPQKGLYSLPDRPLTPSDVSTAAIETFVPHLSVLARGQGVTDTGLLARLVDHGLLEACAGTGSVVVVDAPALSESPAGLDVARAAQGAVLVVGLGVTSVQDVATARRTLSLQGVPLVGALLTRPAKERRRRTTSGGDDLVQPATRSRATERSSGQQSPQLVAPADEHR